MSKGRAHFAAVGRAFAADVRTRDLDAARLTPDERVRLGLQMAASSPARHPTQRELERDGIAQAAFHVRWRKLQARKLQARRALQP